MRYGAPWGKTVKVVTGGIAILFLVIGVAIPPIGKYLLGGTLLVTAMFAPRGYGFEEGHLVVHRRGWRAARIPLRDLTAVRVAPNISSRSIRTFGNGGLFGFTGWFHNSALGRYRAWITDPGRSVALEFDGRPTVVVSPSRTNLFAEELRERTGIEPVFEPIVES